ncbi:hypothetical protein JRO89_XS12G0006200 [Xanthoceras sorbifolium]|uniref:Transducin/WD40 repeat-like superfamily protein n=1 Tax=Xanthoceras sorbifolium TaxID=99658 RepID=A0ABQ8HA61_9ROSI|nr:hypothetical protein JRO89_XS12G0006200 [Xanthoceras sorbifolium]
MEKSCVGQELEEELLGSNNGEVSVSKFDHSVENHFEAIDTISKLCEEPESDGLDEADIQRLSSSITFLRFANETGSSPEKDVSSEINLPQFSSAAVPKEGLRCSATGLESSKDFVMYVGGSVWALDWCPRVHDRFDHHTKCEFIAVAAHPPESYYHRLGVPLTGRGVVQIWCVLNVGVYEEVTPPVKKSSKQGPQSNENIEDKPKKPRGRPRKKPIDESFDGVATKKSTQLKRPRGRPRKKPISESSDDLDGNDQFVHALTTQYPEDSDELLAIERVSECTQEDTVQKNCGKKQKVPKKEALPSNSAVEIPRSSRKLTSKDAAQKNRGKKLKVSKTEALPSNSAVEIPITRKLTSKESAGKSTDDICLSPMTQNKDQGSSITNYQIENNSAKDFSECNNILGDAISDITLASCSVPKDIALPRLVLCLAHNGKVAWDVKWRPYNAKDSKSKQRMGYLAVLLGNGSLEVWEVPLPRTMKFMYLSSLKEGTDPRFVKLEPVFRCSKLKCGGIQSIPLTMEWSSSHPHDFLLAGCHDGMIGSDLPFLNYYGVRTKELLHALRLLCGNSLQVIRLKIQGPYFVSVHGPQLKGHDPFRPLWDLHPAPRFIYAVDWLSDPRCVILTFDDGAIRILSLVKAAYDVPATGKSFAETKPGFHLLNCSSSFAVWSIHVSRLTGMVAYCSADGTILRFQDKSAIAVNTPLLDTPVTLKKPVYDGEKSMRSLMIESNSAKSAKDKKGKILNNQTPAICYGNDPEAESDLPLATVKSRKELKSRNSNRKKADDDHQALVYTDEEASNIHGKRNEKGENGNEVEVLPPKMVALHRVRWNMNRGSERWLCYGGAAGIVRCQEITLVPYADKRSGKNR